MGVFTLKTNQIAGGWVASKILNYQSCCQLEGWVKSESRIYPDFLPRQIYLPWRIFSLFRGFIRYSTLGNIYPNEESLYLNLEISLGQTLLLSNPPWSPPPPLSGSAYPQATMSRVTQHIQVCLPLYNYVQGKLSLPLSFHSKLPYVTYPESDYPVLLQSRKFTHGRVYPQNQLDSGWVGGLQNIKLPELLLARRLGEV